MQSCKNCKYKFSGKYCNACGEKIVEDKDFRLFQMIQNAFESITSFDSKIFRSLKYILFYPGSFSAKFVNGIRVPFMKPFQIFVLCNLIFFIFLSEIDLFHSPSKFFFIDSYQGIKVLDIVEDIAHSKGIKISEVALIYDTKSSNLAKSLIIILIPFIALVSWALNVKKRYPFGKHIIFSSHFFSFFLLISVIFTQIIVGLKLAINAWVFIIPISIVSTLYYIIGLKKFYELNWMNATLKGLIGMFVINNLFKLYAICINLYTLNTI